MYGVSFTGVNCIYMYPLYVYNIVTMCGLSSAAVTYVYVSGRIRCLFNHS